MPPRSKVEQLPTDVREELDRRLQSNGFANYVQLSEWLAEKGYPIGKSALHSYGQDFEARLGSLRKVTEQARIIVSENPDDDGAVNDALIRLTQEKVFGLLIDMEIDPEDVDLVKLTRAIADLSRASVSQKKLAREIRAEVADEAEAAVKEMGLTADRAAELRHKLLGRIKPKEAADGRTGG